MKIRSSKKPVSVMKSGLAANRCLKPRIIRILTPSWVDVDLMKIYGNGRVVLEKRIVAADGPKNIEMKVVLQPEVDTRYIVRAEGVRSMWPVIPDQGDLSVTPPGFTNPVWVDIDGRGFETEKDRAKTFRDTFGNDSEQLKEAIAGKDPWFLRQVLALVDRDSEMESVLIAALRPYEPEMEKIPED